MQICLWSEGTPCVSQCGTWTSLNEDNNLCMRREQLSLYEMELLSKNGFGVWSPNFGQLHIILIYSSSNLLHSKHIQLQIYLKCG